MNTSIKKTAKSIKRESVKIPVKRDRCIVNTVDIVRVNGKWHFDIIFCFGNACGGSPYDEEISFKKKEEALIAGLQAIVDIHTESLEKSGDPLHNYDRKYMESVISAANIMIGNIHSYQALRLI